MVDKCTVCGGKVRGDNIKVIKHCQKIKKRKVIKSGREVGYGIMTCAEAKWSAESHTWYEGFIKGMVDQNTSCL